MSPHFTGVPGQVVVPAAQDPAMSTLPPLRSTRRPAPPLAGPGVGQHPAGPGPAPKLRQSELSHPYVTPATERTLPVPLPRLSGTGHPGDPVRTGTFLDGAHRQPPKKRTPAPEPAAESTSPALSASAADDRRHEQERDRSPRISIAQAIRSDRLADMALAANYCRGQYRPAMQNQERVAHVLGFLLLAELVLDRDIVVDHAGRVCPVGRDRDRDGDTVEAPLWHDIRGEPKPLGVGQWLAYLALDFRSTTLVWRRLVAGGFAAEERASLFRRRHRFELTNAGAPIWARCYLLREVTPHAEVPAPASVLWRGLDALHLATATDLDLPDETRNRLRAEPVPAGVEPLLASLTHSLESSATRLT
ncbi:GPP34 family phosphoprotein [Amycolatopsis sp. cmx-11-51]|uniref:GPP34 family phosphoprotein n=1 Tax=Amycolatopsis sp. cmx-11-51 TaxID=2785797 RepID=UPI0039E4F901